MSRRSTSRRLADARTRRRLATLVAALATVAIALAVAGAVALALFFGPGPPARHGTTSTTVILRQGAGLPEIAADLHRARVIGSDTLFILGAEVTGAAHRLKAGEYAFASRSSLASIMNAIAEGRVVHHFITIPEGVTSEYVMETLMRADFLTGVAPAPPEGSVLPETYEALRGDDRSAVLRRMMDARDKLLAGLWAHRRADLPYKSPEEAVTLASIVEKETALPAERPRIAAVFLNRLKAGMKLQSDPTVIYGLTGGKPLGHGLTKPDLESQTPYNTYVIPGLPPTPIGNPGRASLAAALDPPRTDEVYFVANGTGGHSFASSLAQHQQNVALWRAIEAKRECQAAQTNAAQTNASQTNASTNAVGKPAKC
ncbi:MAG TPA: endolytic transglycosylase MltG [Caulobacteraceae bacterium]|nr:endolytic transglycosylase MltG [Caulobacteraceae bacterium]